MSPKRLIVLVLSLSVLAGCTTQPLPICLPLSPGELLMAPPPGLRSLQSPPSPPQTTAPVTPSPTN